MRTFKSLMATVLVFTFCSAARAELTVASVGGIAPGNSWFIDVSITNTSGPIDFVLAEVTAGSAAFEEQDPVTSVFTNGIDVTTPSGWTDGYGSASMVGAWGAATSGDFDIRLIFDDPAPTSGSNIQIKISAYHPFSTNAFDAVDLTYTGATGIFTGSFSNPTTAPRLPLGPGGAAPVPGAVLLGVMGLGMVGVINRRLV